MKNPNLDTRSEHLLELKLLLRLFAVENTHDVQCTYSFDNCSNCFLLKKYSFGIYSNQSACSLKYVVKHKSAKLFMTYAVGKLEAALNISHLILSTSGQS